MKVVELRAEKMKVCQLILNSGDYYVAKPMCGCVDDLFDNTLAEPEVKSREKVQKVYDSDRSLLKKLDAINNTLCEIDAGTYIEVDGNRLSVATARNYLRELEYDNYDEFEDVSLTAFSEGMFTQKECGSRKNLRCYVLDKAVLSNGNYEDPLKLREKKEENRKKVLDWCVNLRTAIAISDAVTEVEYHD